MLDTNWQKLYEAAILEINPDKVVTLIEAAERAIVEHESRPDVTQLERRKLSDARSRSVTVSITTIRLGHFRSPHRNRPHIRAAFLFAGLLHGTRYGRKHVIGVGTDQPDGANYNH